MSRPKTLPNETPLVRGFHDDDVTRSVVGASGSPTVTGLARLDVFCAAAEPEEKFSQATKSK